MLLLLQMLVQRLQLAGGEVMVVMRMLLLLLLLQLLMRIRNTNSRMSAELLLQLQVLLLQLLLELLLLLLVLLMQVLQLLLGIRRWTLHGGVVCARIGCRSGGGRSRMSKDVGYREALHAFETAARQRRTGGAWPRVLDALQSFQRPKVVIAGLMVMVTQADVMRMAGVMMTVAVLVVVVMLQEMMMAGGMVESMRLVRRRTGRTDRDFGAGRTGQWCAGAEHCACFNTKLCV